MDLPKTYQDAVGLLSPTELEESEVLLKPLSRALRYGSGNAQRRYLLSVYGSIFDVSDRPDKYDPDGPYASLTGKESDGSVSAKSEGPHLGLVCWCRHCGVHQQAP